MDHIFDKLNFDNAKEFIKCYKKPYNLKGSFVQLLNHFPMINLKNRPSNINRSNSIYGNLFDTNKRVLAKSIDIVHRLPDFEDGILYDSKMFLGIFIFKSIDNKVNRIILCIEGRYSINYDSLDCGYALISPMVTATIKTIWQNVYNICSLYEWSDLIVKYPKFLKKLRSKAIRLDQEENDLEY